jgi:hypothetical protein
MRALVAFAIACGPGPGGDLRSEKAPTLEDFELKMCACTDAPCAKRVVAEMAAWSKRIPADAPKPDPTAAAKVMRRYNLCMSNAIGRDR